MNPIMVTPAAVPVQAVPAPMQPTAPPPIQQAAPPAWQPAPQAFQAAHGTFDGVAREVAGGTMQVAPHTVYAATGGGYRDNGYYDDGAGYDVGQGRSPIKEGSPFREYNGGVDQGPQTQSPGQYADTQQQQGSQFWNEIPSASTGYGYVPGMGAVGPNGIPLVDRTGLLTPSQLAELPGTNYNGPTGPIGEITPLSAVAGRWTGPPVDYSDLGIPSDAGNYGGGE